MLPPLLLKEKMGEMPGAGQSHLIFGPGPTGCVTINQPSKPCCANAFYKLLENLDAIALTILFGLMTQGMGYGFTEFYKLLVHNRLPYLCVKT